MVLRPERGPRWERGLLVVLVALGSILTLAALARPAGAAIDVVRPPFCEGEILHDYLAPLDRLPDLHSPPPNGQLGFGSHNILVRQGSGLVVGEGSVGFSLDLDNYNHPARPGWDVTAELSEVNWRGMSIRTVDRLRRRVLKIGREHSADFEFSVGAKPAVYRVTTVFRSLSGKKLGGFGSYFRVVPPTKHARLGLNGDTYQPGQAVFGRVENFGTEPVAYGVPYAIERLEGEAWAKAPESPGGPWVMPLLWSLPGMSGNCDDFPIPATMPPGRYRMTKEIEFPDRESRLGKNQTVVTAEFEVTP
jgi:hypothetical protein